MPMYNPDTSTMPNAQVSDLNIKSLFKFPTRLFAHAMLWFDPKGHHLDVGYLSSDPTVIARQVTFLKTRGVDFVNLEHYGPLSHPCAEAALGWKAECEKQNLNFSIGMDNGMFSAWCKPKGVDVTTWASQCMKYMSDNFFSSPNYEKTPDGRNFMINFNWQGVAGLDAAKVLAQYPNVAMLWEHSGGVSKPGSAGAFAWVGVTASDPLNGIENYTTQFLKDVTASAKTHPKQIIAGRLCRGFDDHNREPGGDPTKSCWDATVPYRFASEKGGKTLLNDVALWNKGPYYPQYMQLVTFTDFEEGTALERGIHSDVTISLSRDKGVLTATLGGTLETVSVVAFFVNGQTVAVLAPAATLTFDLNTLPNLADGVALSCAVGTIGQPLFQNYLSDSLSATPVHVPDRTVNVPVPATQTSVSVPVSGSVNGLNVSGSWLVPVSIPDGTTVPITLVGQTVWS